MASRNFRYLSLIMVLLMGTAGAASSADPKVERRLHRSGGWQQVEVTLTSGEKLKGRLGVVRAETFVLIPAHQGAAPREIRIGDVQKVRARLSLVEKSAIAVLVSVGVLIIASVVLGT